jgi:hypothetical protein
LGGIGEEDVVQVDTQHRVVRVLDAHKKKDVEEYGELWAQHQRWLEAEVAVLEAEARPCGWRGLWGERREQVQAEVSRVMSRVEELCVAEERKLERVQVSKTRRHGWSRQMVAHATALRAVVKMLKWGVHPEEHQEELSQGLRIVARHGGDELRRRLRLPEAGAVRGTVRWRQEAGRVAEELRRQLHGKTRARDAAAMTWHTRLREERRQAGKLGVYIDSVLKQGGRSGRLQQMSYKEVQGDGDEAKEVEVVVSDPQQLCEQGVRYMEERYFGKERRRWYLGHEELGGSGERHPIWEKGETGRQARMRLDEGDETVLEGVPEVMKGVGRECRRLLKGGGERV